MLWARNKAVKLRNLDVRAVLTWLEECVPYLAWAMPSKVTVIYPIPARSIWGLFTRTRNEILEQLLIQIQNTGTIRQLSCSLLHITGNLFKLLCFLCFSTGLECDKVMMSMAGCPLPETTCWLRRWKSPRSLSAAWQQPISLWCQAMPT